MPTKPEILNPGTLLKNLGAGMEAIPTSQLYPLSDLTAKQLGEYRAVWDTLPVKQRRRLAHALVEVAEAHFELNFDEIFAHCLFDPDQEIRAAAIDGLWENEQVALVGPFLAMLRSDPSAQVRSAAAAGLGRYVLAGELEQLEPAIQVRIMIELLTTFHLAGEAVDVRRRALESAAYACTEEVLELLDLAYFDDDEKMRISAIAGMGRSCDQRWAENILIELESSTADMRYEAALASGELALRQAVPLLTRLMHDADGQIREAAIHALGQIGGSEAKEALLAAYDDAGDDARTAIDDALAEHALTDGDLDLLLYETGGDLGDDRPFDPWSVEEDEPGDNDLDDWMLDAE